MDTALSELGPGTEPVDSAVSGAVDTISVKDRRKSWDSYPDQKDYSSLIPKDWTMIIRGYMSVGMMPEGMRKMFFAEAF